MRRSVGHSGLVLALVVALLPSGCSDDKKHSGGDDPDSDFNADPGPVTQDCEVALAVTVASALRIGRTTALTISGGSGDVSVGVSGGSATSTTFTAPLSAGAVTITVTDTVCATSASATVTVVGPLTVAPADATVRPATAFTPVVTNLIGTAAFTVDSAVGSTIDSASGAYVAGASAGVDVILVSDSADLASTEAQILVDPAAQLQAAWPALAVPSGVTVPLVARGGSDTVVWSLVSGPGAVVAGAYISATNDVGTAELEGHDDFTGDTTTARITLLTSPTAAAANADRLGAAVAASSTSLGDRFLVGAPAAEHEGAAVGRAWLGDTAMAELVLAAEGATSPGWSGEALGTGVAFTDFNGDGRHDLVMGAPHFVPPDATLPAGTAAGAFATVHAGCVTAEPQVTGGVIVALGAANGSFTSAYRLWSLQGPIDGVVAGDFDFNGDGQKDIAARRSHGLDIYLGRAPEDSTLAKLTMGCDPMLSIDDLPGDAGALQPLADLNGDGCTDIAIADKSAAYGGITVVYGFDLGGARCGGRTTYSAVRITSDIAAENVAFAGLGTGVAYVPQYFGGVSAFAVTATATSASVPSVLFLQPAAVNALRPSSGRADVPLTTTLTNGYVLQPAVADASFGAQLAGVDLDDDGHSELIVTAPGASIIGTQSGAVHVFAAPSYDTTGPSLVITTPEPDAAFGLAVAVQQAVSGRTSSVTIGAPGSQRNGPTSGAVHRYRGL